MKQGELDFVIAKHGKVIPIEVKAGKDYERHNALTNVLANDDYNIDFAYVHTENPAPANQILSKLTGHLRRLYIINRN